MRYAVYTLGCKVNQYETQAMETILRQRGHELVDFESPADAYVVNTCTVTNIADRKSRQMLHRAKKQNPDAVVVAVGCYVETDPDRVERDEAGILRIYDSAKPEEVVAWLYQNALPVHGIERAKIGLEEYYIELMSKKEGA